MVVEVWLRILCVEEILRQISATLCYVDFIWTDKGGEDEKHHLVSIVSNHSSNHITHQHLNPKPNFVLGSQHPSLLTHHIPQIVSLLTVSASVPKPPAFSCHDPNSTVGFGWIATNCSWIFEPAWEENQNNFLQAKGRFLDSFPGLKN